MADRQRGGRGGYFGGGFSAAEEEEEEEFGAPDPMQAAPFPRQVLVHVALHCNTLSCRPRPSRQAGRGRFQHLAWKRDRVSNCTTMVCKGVFAPEAQPEHYPLLQVGL